MLSADTSTSIAVGIAVGRQRTSISRSDVLEDAAAVLDADRQAGQVHGDLDLDRSR